LSNTKIILFIVLSISQLLSQIITNEKYLEKFADERSIQYNIAKSEIAEFAEKNNIPIRQEFENGNVIEIQYIENGIPIYYVSTNLGAAQTTRTDRLWPRGNTELNLTGNGYSSLGMWDGGGVRLTHQEFAGRVLQIDNPSSIFTHATHVAGTLVSSGIERNAIGMANQANLNAYDWNNDESEMAIAAGNGLEVSNHSYAQVSGWFYNTWFGDVNISTSEDFKFGFYSIYTFFWDNIAYNAPNYLIVKAVGNDHSEFCDTSEVCYVWIDGVKVENTKEREPDGGGDGYDCIPPKGVAKNILTVGAIGELLNYTTPSDIEISKYSSWGPVDDGRIKPDIVSKGDGLYSTDSDSDDDYTTYSGTSKASANVTGTLALLQQHYQNTHLLTPMRSATLKALVLHTANEAGSAVGPDYQHGWGLLNAENAAELITLDSDKNYNIDEQILNNGESFTKYIYSDGALPIKVTICWTDPPATPVADQLNPRTSMLINDIDLRVTNETNIHYPWKLDPENPSHSATNNSKNYVDNVEQVYIVSPIEGTYRIEVSHDESLFGGSQAFSIIVSGNSESSIDHDSVYPLIGSHEVIKTDCSKCHSDGYSNSSTECVSCHLVDYNESTNPNHLTNQFTQDCEFCHNTELGWTPSTYEHDTIYPLLGGHEAIKTNCVTCHKNGYLNTVTECISCHLADYDTSTDPNHLVNNFSKDCEICHTTESGWVSDSAPDKFTISNAYPNPFNPTIDISYGLPKKENVEISVYDLNGSKMVEYNFTSKSAGWHEFRWNALDQNDNKVTSGIYILAIKTGSTIKTQKITFLK
jgi:hypothetical protein